MKNMKEVIVIKKLAKMRIMCPGLVRPILITIIAINNFVDEKEDSQIGKLPPFISSNLHPNILKIFVTVKLRTFYSLWPYSK